MKAEEFRKKVKPRLFGATLLLLPAFVLVSLVRCATIIHGPQQTIDISSQPSEALVFIDDKAYGTTPALVSLSRKGRLEGEPSSKKEYAVRIELEGYYPYEIKLKRTIDGWFFGNVLIGGFIGIVIDAATGSLYRLNPDQVIATLGQKPGNKNEDIISIGVQLEIDPEWEKCGSLTVIE